MDEELANNLPLYCNYFNIEKFDSPTITHYVDNTKILHINNYIIKVILTPGHTMGGVSYLFDNYLFTGDTIFNKSIGRTDLPGGNYTLLLESIKNNILTLDKNIEIFSGHGNKTTIGDEIKNNPFLK